MKYTENNSQTTQDKVLFLSLENNIRGRIPSVMGDRYAKLDENEKILHIDPDNLYGLAMSETLLEVKFDKTDKLEDILNTPDDSYNGHCVEVDLKDPDQIKEKTTNQKTFHFVLRIKLVLKISLVNL